MPVQPGLPTTSMPEAGMQLPPDVLEVPKGRRRAVQHLLVNLGPPFKDLTAWQHLDPDGKHKGPTTILQEMVQERCDHKTVNKSGSNGYWIKERCRLCHKILKDDSRKMEPRPTSAPQDQHEEEKDFEELAWRRRAELYLRHGGCVQRDQALPFLCSPCL